MEEQKQQFLIRELINEEAVVALSERLKDAYAPFEKDDFVKEIMKELPGLSIGDRSQLIKSQLFKFLPEEFPKACDILVRSLMQSPKEGEPSTAHFILWPLTMYVSEYGLAYLSLSMSALYEMTKRFTAEFGIRAILDKYPEETWTYLEKWSQDPNPHVRRLVSEGTRPRLPWAARLKHFGKDPRKMLLLLKGLAEDPSEMVRRSVANHLNDLSKENPKLVVNTLAEWQREMPTFPVKMMKHALRTLIKSGDKDALALLGVTHGILPAVKRFVLKESSIRLGDHLEIEAELEFKEKGENIHIIDYLIYYLKANGSHQAKVFKWKTLSPISNTPFSLKKRHLMQHFTTRTHYIGTHYVALQINGVESDKLEFKLTL